MKVNKKEFTNLEILNISINLIIELTFIITLIVSIISFFIGQYVILALVLFSEIFILLILGIIYLIKRSTLKKKGILNDIYIDKH